MTTLSPLDKLMPRGYVRQMFCFPSTHPEVPHVVKEGLCGVVADVPYLLSGIIIEEDNKRISLSEPYQTLEDVYSEQDLSDAADYAVMKEGHFPPSAFTVPGMIPPDTQPPLPNPTPVFRARLSLVKGGFVLCVAVHHCTTDITGFGSLLKLWASYCRTDASAAAGFGPAWLDRKALLEQSNTTKRPAPTSIPELLHVQQPDVLYKRSSLMLPPRDDFATEIFFFPQRTLQALKHAVNEHIAREGGAGWISTGDILTALLWAATSAAELDPMDLTGTHTIGLPVNFRSRCSPPLSPDYLGAAFLMTTATDTMEDLVALISGDSRLRSDTPLDHVSIQRLAKIASIVRASIRRVDEKSARDVLMYLDVVSDDHAPIKLGPRHSPISIVSWADQGTYELDWGEIVGRCEAVRLPKLMFKRYPIVLPRVPDGVNGGEAGLEVIVSFESHALKSFGQNPLIQRLATLRCHS
ncbi:transferase family-domain-containing protein [Hypoxylon fuscum]|nr:transferase family-domain-containing protein [Hypoxylon fuscum]